MRDERPAKFDLRRELPALYAPRNRQWAPVEVPAARYLMIDGSGDPNSSPAYAAAVEALFSVSYPVKFASKKELGRDYVVAPLEGLWFADDPAVFVRRQKDAFGWTMMIRQPEWIDPDLIDRARERAVTKRPDLPHDRLRLGTLTEGPCLQVLHIGPYDDEGPILQDLHEREMPERGLTFAGHHHEIYLSDPRRAAPDRLRTILRQPVRPLAADPV